MRVAACGLSYGFRDRFIHAESDHLLLSPPLAGRLVAAGVDRHVRGREKASDHAPA
jgi:exonuclease III